VTANQPQQRLKPIRRENWTQFALGDPESEAAALSELDASFGLKQGWHVDGGANVYFRGKGALAVVPRTCFNIIVSGIAAGGVMRAARHARRTTYTLTSFFAFRPTYIRALYRSRGL